MLDVRIENARIIDGSGKPAYTGNLGVSGEKLVMPVGGEEAKLVIDANSRYVCPGFIDAHSHGDLILGSESSRLFKTTQGITTEVIGQCGLSIAPVNPLYLNELQRLLSLGTSVFPDDMQNWSTFERYLKYADRQPKTANAMMYIGHCSLRMAVMGMDNRAATEDELDRMKSLLCDAMEHGAAGFSTGLIYAPSCYASREEITELARVIHPYDGVYATHLRDESSDIARAVKEAIETGRKAGVRVCISHHKVSGSANWGLQKVTLRLIEEARDEGINVFYDQYPYLCGMTHLNACIPPWHFDGGYEALTKRLKDPGFRASLRREMEDPKTKYSNNYLNSGGWAGVTLASAPATPNAEGKSVIDYAEAVGRDPFDAFFDIMIANGCECNAIYDSMCEEDVCEIALGERCIVGTDGCTRSWEEKGHPRASGAFPHAISYFVKEKGLLSLEDMIRKMTGLSADFLAIRNKGYLREGYDADMVIFDFDRLKDTSTYVNSNSLSEGIDYVFTGGQAVYRNKQFTGVFPGKMIRHNA